MYSFFLVIMSSLLVRMIEDEDSKTGGTDHENVNALNVVLERWIDQPEFFAVPELFSFEAFSVLCRVHPRERDVFVEGVLPLIQGGVLR